MKIFDGVEVNPAKLSPTWQGVIGAAMLVGNVFMEADKVRCEREAKDPAETSAGPTTLADVMEQSGLKIPHLQDALATFMGGTDEAKEVAAMIVDLPDPAKLLREFTKQYRRQSTPTTAAANGPIVTPPPASASGPSVTPAPVSAAGPAPEPAAPTTAATPKLATFRPEFTPEGLAADAAERTPAGPRPKLATFRPEFTPEGLAAPTAAAAPSPKLATFRPEFTPEGLAAAGRTAKPATPDAPTRAPAAVSEAAPQTTGSETPAGRSLADAIVERLESLAIQRTAHEADLDTRMRCAEAELAMLHEELLALRALGERPILFVVPPPDEAAASTGAPTSEPDETIDPAGDEVITSDEASPPNVEASTPASPVSNTVDEARPPSVEARTPVSPVPNTVDEASPPSIETSASAVGVAEVAEEPVTNGGDESVESASTEVDVPQTGPTPTGAEAVSSGTEHTQTPLPAPSSDADLARAFALVHKFGDEQQASYARDSERMRSLERMISTLRGQVESERSRRSAGGHG